MTTTTLELHGVTAHSTFSNGVMRDCTLDEPNVISTSVGELIPRYEKLEVRTKPGQSVSFYKSGALRTVYLEDQTEIDTPIGPLKAELVSFYEDGSLNTVFQLNGQLSYAWTENDEAGLAEEWSLDFDFDRITTKLISLRFYPTGEIRSLTLWPGESLMLKTPIGKRLVRTGIRLHPNGALASFEPAVPMMIDTPIGPVSAYDVDAFTVDGDQNSVRFDQTGRLEHVMTAGAIVVEAADGTTTRINSNTRYALTADIPVKLAIEIAFHGDQVTIDNSLESHTFTIDECTFTTLSEIETTALTACDMRCETGAGADFGTDGCTSGGCGTSSGGCGTSSGDGCGGGSCSTAHEPCENCADGKCTGMCA